MFYRVPIWLVLLLGLTLLLVFWGITAAGYHAVTVGSQNAIAKLGAEIISYPTTAKRVLSVLADPGFDSRATQVRANETSKHTPNGVPDDTYLLLLSRYDGDRKTGVVEVIEPESNAIIHTYVPDHEELFNNPNIPKHLFDALKVDAATNRFRIMHPLILNDGTLVSHSEGTPLFAINPCGAVVWVNSEDRFHHSIKPGLGKTIWVSSFMDPLSATSAPFVITRPNFREDAITQLNHDGEILYQKSLVEIVEEDGRFSHHIFATHDPFHLNDIEPALSDGPFWKAGDVFLSLAGTSEIILFRPNSSKIIKILKGPFSAQHDVNIISDTQISFFNNNLYGPDNRNSNVVIYDFETQKFSFPLKDTMTSIDLYTYSQGLVDGVGSPVILIEEQNRGTVFLLRSDGSVLSKFINKSRDGIVYGLNWSRLINDKDSVVQLKKSLGAQSC